MSKLFIKSKDFSVFDIKPIFIHKIKVYIWILLFLC